MKPNETVIQQRKTQPMRYRITADEHQWIVQYLQVPKKPDAKPNWRAAGYYLTLQQACYGLLERAAREKVSEPAELAQPVQAAVVDALATVRAVLADLETRYAERLPHPVLSKDLGYLPAVEAVGAASSSGN